MVFKSTKMIKFITASAAAAMIATAAVPAVSADTVSTTAFSDVPARYATSVDYLVSNNLSKGLTATQYGIHTNIKRGDAAIILAQALGLMDAKATNAGFTDVPARGAVAINSLKAAGIVNGKTATNFGFHDLITRGEVALIMAHVNAYNFQGDPTSLPFTDVNARYRATVAGLLANGITQGTSATQFSPGNSIKRGDFAIFTYRAEVLSFGGEALTEFRESMNEFASVGAEVGFKVVVDETKANTFNILGDSEAVSGGDGGTGFFTELADQGVETIRVNDQTFAIADSAGTVLPGAGEARQAILASILGNETVNVTFLIPFEGSIIEAPYTFNLQL